MGAPAKDIESAEQAMAADTLLSAFRTIAADDRQKHANVYSYWQSIRGDRDFPTFHDLDPLKIADAGPSSVVLELFGGGEDAEIRHLGELLKAEGEVARIIDAPRPSVLSCIAKKLAIVAISRDALAFEDEYPTANGNRHCCITLLPFSSTGAWVDFVYGFVTTETVEEPVEPAAEIPPVEEVEEEAPEVEPAGEPASEAEEEIVAEETAPQPDSAPVEPAEPTEADSGAPPSDSAATEGPGFSAKVFNKLAGLEGFFGTHAKVAPTLPATPAEPSVAADPAPAVVSEPAPPVEAAPVEVAPVEAAPADDIEPAAAGAGEVEQPIGSESVLQSKFEEMRAKAGEARQAKLRARAALHEGLSAAYDFALDAEEQPEEYLKLVEAQGLRIQLRSPMAPVARLAFDGVCDDATIANFETVLAWALQSNLPRGTLAERIEAAGGIGPLLSGQAG